MQCNAGPNRMFWPTHATAAAGTAVDVGME